MSREAEGIAEKREGQARVIAGLAQALTGWYLANRRDLPWRRDRDPYHIWVSEIMLQQTRVEAVKPYYARFLAALPDISALAEVPSDQLLKLWEGLGYYSRVRNMQTAARQIMDEYGGSFPRDYARIRQLKGIGSYTAGAVASIAFGLPVPAVDGNVLRVLSRLLCSEEDILRQSVKRGFEDLVSRAFDLITEEEKAGRAGHAKEGKLWPGDFNQSLIELGALVCLPGSQARCPECPVRDQCQARALGKEADLPVRKKPAKRRIQERTILIFRDGDAGAIRQRPKKGLLAGMYEPVNLEGHLSADEVLVRSRQLGLSPLRILPLEDARHIFSHIEWRMRAYYVLVDELEKSCKKDLIFAREEEIRDRYPMPSAFDKYIGYLTGEKRPG